MVSQRVPYRRSKNDPFDSLLSLHIALVPLVVPRYHEDRFGTLLTGPIIFLLLWLLWLLLLWCVGLWPKAVRSELTEERLCPQDSLHHRLVLDNAEKVLVLDLERDELRQNVRHRFGRQLEQVRVVARMLDVVSFQKSVNGLVLCVVHAVGTVHAPLGDDKQLFRLPHSRHSSVSDGVVSIYLFTIWNPSSFWCILVHMLNWYWVLALVVPAYVAQILVHEGAHVLFATAYGQRLREFRIWPGFDEVDGHFFFARVRYQANDALLLTDAQVALRAWAPFVVGLPPWVLFAALAGHWSTLELTPAVSIIVVYWTALSVDVVRGLAQGLIYPQRGYLDINKGARYAGLPKWATRVLGGTLAGLLTVLWACIVWPIIQRSW